MQRLTKIIVYDSIKGVLIEYCYNERCLQRSGHLTYTRQLVKVTREKPFIRDHVLQTLKILVESNVAFHCTVSFQIWSQSHWRICRSYMNSYAIKGDLRIKSHCFLRKIPSSKIKRKHFLEEVSVYSSVSEKRSSSCNLISVSSSPTTMLSLWGWC